MRRPDRHRRQHAPGVWPVGRLPDENSVPARLFGEEGKLELLRRRPAGQDRAKPHLISGHDTVIAGPADITGFVTVRG